MARLAVNGSAPALHDASGTVTYSELDRLVEDAAGRIKGPRRVQVVAMANDLASVVRYLGALRAGNPVLLCAPDRAGELEALYGGVTEVHPELTLLLSTSGSTGSPKLVRLSAGNVDSNSAAIATYLGLTDRDRAITSLPLHYCYGLSVLHSHLHSGASVVLTGTSVVDPCFWELVDRHDVTNLAGVPHTFELLERTGFDALQVPSLRFVTQAGGRLAPTLVRQLAAKGEREGWDLFVMYGQTEATARMAYLPPHRAADSPEAIGIPIPGGSFRLDTSGELVFSGPNVMLGYATAPEDLALGRTVSELRTGDLARQRPDGLWQITGRRSRFVKVFGVRVDLDRAEAILEAEGFAARCTGTDDDGVVVVAEQDPAQARLILAEHSGLPMSRVHGLQVEGMPVRPNGKPDYARMLEAHRERAASNPVDPPDLAGPDAGTGPIGSEPTGPARRVLLRRFGSAALLPGVSFVDLGGDSLTYIETSIDLEAAIGALPQDWHLLPVEALEEAAEPTGRGVRLDTSVLVRAVAITAVLLRHTAVLDLAGGAHMLLVVSGFNFGRFQVGALDRGARVSSLLGSISRFALPASAWIVFVMLASGEAGWANAGFVSVFTAPEHWEPRWRYWYLEAVVQILVVAAALLAVPAVRRALRSQPFWIPMGLACFALVTRYRLVMIGPELRQFHMAHSILWLFLAGWAAQRARTTGQRIAVSLFAVVCVHGFFGNQVREALVVAVLLLVTWVPTLRVPRIVLRPLASVAAASMYLYLTHWQVYEPLEDHGVPAMVGLVASFMVGILTWKLVGCMVEGAPRLLRLPVASGRRLRSPLRPAGAA